MSVSEFEDIFKPSKIRDHSWNASYFMNILMVENLVTLSF
jgi:hypothetical protein